VPPIALPVPVAVRRLVLTGSACALGVLVLAHLPAPPISDGTSSSDPTTGSIASPTTTTLPAAAPDQATLDAVGLGLAEVVGVAAPTDLTSRPGDDGALYIAERAGRVVVFADGALAPEPVLDVSADTSTDIEKGLLGLAFSPDGSRMYVTHNGADGHLYLAEYAVADRRVDPASRRVLLMIEKENPVHNGGDIGVTPDGLVWLSTGDGGPVRDPPGTAQDPVSPLGKLLRLDPSASQPQPEVIALGLRNPWRWSFDRATGDIWIGDVGRYQNEEIDLLPAAASGMNFQWPLREGNDRRLGDAPAGSTPPVHAYAHNGRCSVIGGFVYRGTAIAGLAGAYIYGDLCDGQIRAMSVSGGQVSAARAFELVVPTLTSFGEDEAGELYAMSLEGMVYRLVAA
jgi:glucose/arabinose dehydrogenase